MQRQLVALIEEDGFVEEFGKHHLVEEQNAEEKVAQ